MSRAVSVSCLANLILRQTTETRANLLATPSGISGGTRLSAREAVRKIPEQVRCLGKGEIAARIFEFLRTPGQLRQKKRARIACGEHASVQLRKAIKAKDLMGCEHVTHVFFSYLQRK